MSAVAVVGMACRYPDADAPEELWRNVLSQRRAFRRIPAERLREDDYFASDPAALDRTYAFRACVLDGWEFDRVRFGISGRTFRSTDLAHWLALEVAADALADAGHPDGDGLDRDRTLVVVGNTLTGEFSRARTLRLRWPYVRRVVAAALLREGRSEDERSDFLAHLERDFKAPFAPVDEDTLAGGLSNTIAGRICNSFDFKGGGYTVDGACAASLLAVTTAADALERGDADVAIAGGVDLSLDPFELVGFAKAGALARDEMRVYDARPQGFWPGEGCGFVVLRRLQDAAEERDEPQAVLRGWGVSSDGTGGITRPEVAGQTLALQRAYARAGFGIDTVAYFEGHGTGTSVGDATELATLDGARREAGAARAAALGSVKANIGHTKAAAGIAGLIKAVLAVREELVPPTTGCDEPHEQLRRAGATLEVTREPRPFPPAAPVRAAVSAMGFGGINAHVVLERAAARRRTALRPNERRYRDSWQDAELFLFAGTRAEVAEEMRSAAREASALSLAELGDLAASLERRLPAGEVAIRAAAVASRPDELAASLDVLLSRIDAGATTVVDAAAAVALAAAAGGRVGLLFTGQGAPAPADGGALGRRFAPVRDLYARARLDPSLDRVDTAVAQPAIVTASLAGLAFLRHLGVDGDVAVGHSLGELTALCWAGALEEADTIALAAARGRAMSECSDEPSAMANLGTDVENARRLVTGTDAVVAAVNGPLRSVVSGTADAVATVTGRAEGEGIPVTRLRVSHAFHSPLVAGAVEPLRAALAQLVLQPPSRRVVSTVTGLELGAGTDVRALLERQVLSPVLFADALAVAARDVDALVEVGPGDLLAGIAREAVELPVLALDAAGPSLRQPLFTAGALYALGAPVDHAALFADRFTRPFELGRPRVFLANPCEAAPVVDDGGPVTAEEPASGQEDAAGSDAMAVVRALVASRAELPADSIRPETRLLGDLHLSSIAVSEIAASAAHGLGVAPPTAPGEFATATVAELVEALERLRATAPGPEPAFPAGVAAWVRPLESVLVPRARAEDEVAATAWHVLGPPGHELTARVAAAFAGGVGVIGIAVVLPADRREDAPTLLLAAAREARARDAARFAVLEERPTGAAFARVVRVESGIDTCVVRGPAAELVAAGRGEAETTRGYREVAIGDDGIRRVPVLQPLQPAASPWPLAANDVLLVTGGGKGIGATSALELARRHGLALGLIGRADPVTDGELAANLRRFAAAGVRHLYVRADVVDAGAVAEAVAAVEAELGPVAGVLHSAGVNAPALLADVDEETLRATLRPKVEGLRNVVRAIGLERLKLVVAFGSLIGRVGIRGEAHYALANQWLADLVGDFGARAPHCRCLTVEWSIWSGVGMGERLGTVEALARAGITAIPADEGVRLLEQLICAETPSAVVAAGRFGRPRTVEFAPRDVPVLRFLQRPLLEYPGIELVVEADLSPVTDPYLADHALDGVPLLPGVIGLEAMAQAAVAVAGFDAVAEIENVELTRPVTVPPDGTRTIRLAALRRRDGAVDVVLRSDETGFAADHFRCTFREASRIGPGARRETPPRTTVGLAPADVYDALLFHGPRFRRLRGYRTLTARTCVAEVEARSGDRWFGDYLPQQLVLGDPGARDAIVHVLQACIPHARVLPVSVERIVSGPLAEGLLLVDARERRSDGETFVWDVDVTDAEGEIVERWEALTLRRVGPALRPPEQWAPPLLVPYLERRVAELAGARIGVTLVKRERGSRAATDAAIGAAAGRRVDVRRDPDGRPVVERGGVSAAHIDGYTLAVAGDGRVTCDVEEARAGRSWHDLLGAQRLVLASCVAADLDEDVSTSAARVWAAAECARKSGRPARETLALASVGSDGWALLRAGGAPVATYAGHIAGVDPPVAFAFLIEEEQ
jgi:enediyne polyketide synthase